VASAGSVTVDFDARSAKFAAELEKVQGSLRRIEGGAASVAKGLQLLSGVLSVGVVLNYARAMFEAADAIGDAAARSGVAVESLSRLKFVAEQSDVEFQALTVGIKKFQQGLSEANSGTASAVKSFAELGIEAGTIRNLALEEQLGVIADGFRNILNPADQTRIAIELFGKAGQDLIPFLNLGSAGIRELADEADRLGITLSGPAVAGIGASDQAFKKLSATLAGFVQNRLGDLALTILGTDFLPQLDQANIRLQRLLEEKQRIELSGAPEGSGFAARLREIQVEAGRAAAEVAKLTQGAAADGAARDSRRQLLDDIAEFNRTTVELEKQLAAAPARTLATAQPTPEELRNRAGAADTSPFNQLNVEQFELQEVANQAHLDRLLEQQRVYAQNIVLTGEESASALALLRQEYGIQEINFEELKSATIQDIQSSLALSGLQIATAIFGQNKKVAIAVAALNIAVGATEALKLPYPANILAVAKVLAQGAQLMSRIRSANIGSGGGFGGVSSGGVGASQTPGTEDRPIAAGVADRSATNVYINGVVDKRVVDQLVTALRGEMDRDVVIIPGNSRQAIELRGA
jgi:hypothetical protein